MPVTIEVGTDHHPLLLGAGKLEHQRPGPRLFRAARDAQGHGPVDIGQRGGRLGRDAGSGDGCAVKAQAARDRPNFRLGRRDQEPGRAGVLGPVILAAAVHVIGCEHVTVPDQGDGPGQTIRRPGKIGLVSGTQIDNRCDKASRLRLGRAQQRPHVEALDRAAGQHQVARFCEPAVVGVLEHRDRSADCFQADVQPIESRQFAGRATLTAAEIA